MASLTTIIPIAASCSAFFTAIAVIGIVAWVRWRRVRRAKAALNTSQHRYALGAQHQYDTMTELSHEVGTALRRHGQLPYGLPTEWGLLTSRDTLARPATPPESKPTTAKRVKSFRKSLSFTRPKRRPASDREQNNRELHESLTASPKRLPSTDATCVKERVQISAVEGILELPAETTPRHTPEIGNDGDGSNLNIRPISSGSTMAQSPLSTKEYRAGSRPLSARARGRAIATQSPGVAPSQPAPLPPVVYPPSRFTLSRDISSMQLSLFSTDTADSSILDDGIVAMAPNLELASPTIHTCPTFAPYCADDVGRGYIMNGPEVSSSSLFRQTAYSSNSTLLSRPQREHPRRSQTTRSPSYTTEQTGAPPRRSESLYTSPAQKESHLGPQSMSHGEPPLLPHFNQQLHSLINNSALFDGGQIPVDTAKTPATGIAVVREPPQRVSEIPQWPPLHSAMRGGKGTQRGHRRQNGVRTPIHPSVALGATGFPPMLEEPEVLEDPDIRSQALNLSRSNLPSSDTGVSPSPASMRTLSLTRRPTASRDPHYSPVTPTKKRKHSQPDDDTLPFNENENIPSIFIAIPSGNFSLSSPPSPDRAIPGWQTQEDSSTNISQKNQGVPSSRRRSTVKGPRSQPGKPGSNPRSSGLVRKSDVSAASESPSYSLRLSNSSYSKIDNHQGNNALSQIFSPAQGKNRPKSSQVVPPDERRSLGANRENSVAIWEDQRQGQISSTRSPLVCRTAVESENSPQKRIEQPKSALRVRKSLGEVDGQTAPTNWRVGLGIETTTPGSLYDREGFLMEYVSRIA